MQMIIQAPQGCNQECRSSKSAALTQCIYRLWRQTWPRDPFLRPSTNYACYRCRKRLREVLFLGRFKSSTFGGVKQGSCEGYVRITSPRSDSMSLTMVARAVARPRTDVWRRSDVECCRSASSRRDSAFWAAADSACSSRAAASRAFSARAAATLCLLSRAFRAACSRRETISPYYLLGDA